MSRSALLTVLLHLVLVHNVPLPEDRIIGGRDIDITDIPYQAHLLFFYVPFCGASIISETFFITAGHCTSKFPRDFLSIRVGTSTPYGGLTYKIDEVYLHPHYDKRRVDFDISILNISEPLIFTERVQPIALPAETERISEGSIALVSGWGKLMENGPKPHILQAAQVSIYDKETCKSRYQTLGRYITNRMLCAGHIGGGRDACQGDSGGPLVANNVLVGVVSWGIGCGRGNSLGIYSNISAVRSFITQVTNL